MDEHTYKHIEITGTARSGVDAAIQNAITKASESVRNLQWFQVIDTRGHIENGKVDHWQVTVKIGFRLDD